MRMRVNGSTKPKRQVDCTAFDERRERRGDRNGNDHEYSQTQHTAGERRHPDMLAQKDGIAFDHH
jgi:hypothetical protein